MTTWAAEPIPTDLPATPVVDEAVARHFLRRGRGLEFAMEANWVRARLPDGEGRIVDLGCGIGTLFDAIGTHRAAGVDYKASGLKHTHARFPMVPLLCASAEHLPFADASLDGLILQHVVEHLPEAPASCPEFYRVLRPGGVLLLLTPNAEFCDQGVFEDPTHVQIFNRRDLSDILIHAGFSIVDLRTLGLPWLRRYHAIRSAWRLRRWVTEHAVALSTLPRWRWMGQTLCCAARRPLS